VFRVRGGPAHGASVAERLRARGFTLRTLDGMPGFHRVERAPIPLSATPEHWLGLVYQQQASTGVAAPTLAPGAGERVLDLCAAPGGKTTHIADLMGDSGCLVASEISESRIRGLLGNVYRLGHTGIFVVASDGRDFPLGALFDRVLLDVPCSGEGTLRRRGGQPPDQSASFRTYVTRVQRALLERAVRLTRPGGTILYVTCTFAPEENEAVVSEALARLPLDLEPIELPVPHAPGLTAFEGTTYDPRLAGAARIYPHHLDSGGLFLAKLRRCQGEPSAEPGDPSSTGRGDAAVAASARESRWSSVPAAFPGERISAAEAIATIDAGIGEVLERFGIADPLDDLRWTLRGGRAWAHTLDAWPGGLWEDGPWRPISVGIRAIDFDSRGRARPSNDFLRWLGSRMGQRVLDLDDDRLGRLLERHPVPTDFPSRGPVALRWHGDVIGRGAVTVDGLKSEIPRARAADLRRCLEASGS
jgi:NOL1/NOP2/sun family putative RNA methylase